MTDNDKKLIAEYMRWAEHPSSSYEPPEYYLNSIKIEWNIVDAVMCIIEIKNRHELENLYTFNTHSEKTKNIHWLSSAESFFTTMAAWLKE